ncbi:MAG: hypothetical protein WCX48_11220 [Bacteroidales bacterium]|jgi:hypothetical protein
MNLDYTTVVGVDERHLRQLAMTWPTWRKNKPSLLCHPMIVFIDRDQVTPEEVSLLVDHPNLLIVRWPPPGITFAGREDDKWTNPQRHKMLAGFVHVPAFFVKTPWWLKLDCDVIATGKDDWIDERWFEGNPAIVSQPWNFTKPPGQMLQLDEWIEVNSLAFPDASNLAFPIPPLNMIPKPGADRIGHKRIISNVAFFNTDFTRKCSTFCTSTCGLCQIPVPSQDGTMWYLAKRMGRGIVRVQMKSLGWQVWSTEANIRKYSEEAMK